MIMQSVGERFDRRITSGFDYLRLSLSLGVLTWHNFNLSYGMDSFKDFGQSIWAIPVRIILPLFFALSGFLVASSLERVSSLDRFSALRIFLWHRLIRLFPALSVEVGLSAFLLGPTLTIFALREYFSDPQFIRYFLNIVGLIHFELPGLFLSNPFPEVVNGSLWTIPYELECYIALTVLFALGVTKRLNLLVVVFCAMTALLVWRHLDLEFNERVAVPGRRLVLDFIAGVIVYKIRAHVPGGALSGFVSIFISSVLLYHPIASMFSPIFVAHSVAALGSTAPTRVPIIMSGDYSYGIYLYAFPIQQAVVLLNGAGKPWETLLISIICVCIFSVISWHLIEKPVLKYKSLYNVA